MSTGKTEHYGLHIWEAGDDFLREEFNENFRRLDGLIPRIVTGTYTGTGYNTTLEIVLGFRPRALHIEHQGGYREFGSTSGGLLFVDAPFIHKDITYGTITENGFRVSGYPLNTTKPYYYMAFLW